MFWIFVSLKMHQSQGDGALRSLALAGRSCPSGKQQLRQRIPLVTFKHHNTCKQSVFDSPTLASTLDQYIRSYRTRHDVSQPKNPRRKPHPQHIPTVYRPNFRLKDKAVVALACAACSVDSEHERHGEPFAHDRGPGRGYAGSWRICRWHVSQMNNLDIGVRLMKLEHRFMAASKVLGEETVNGAAGAAADASQNKRS